MSGSLEELILNSLSEGLELNTSDFANKEGVDHQLVVGTVKSLQSLGDIVKSEQINRRQWVVTGEGSDIITGGSHEFNIFNKVPETGGIPQKQLESLPNGKIGLSKALANKWLRVDKSSGDAVIHRKTGEVTDDVKVILEQLQSTSIDGVIDDKKLNDLKRRKLIKQIETKSYSVSKGSEFTLNPVRPETDLSPEMIASGAWKNLRFKPYNFDALGLPVSGGHLHPLLKVRTQFRQIFLEMGFSEMPTNAFVDSSFWNFDALFQPQLHPARDQHDTFFLADPATTPVDSLPPAYLARVASVHSEGGYGSLGYQSPWRLDEARKNILRTHTTGTSARMLYNLANQPGGFTPAKYFSIDRVFRNETLDATHLAEFHQIEGLVADYNLTLGDLMGLLQEFFKKLGIEQLRFKPAYNPYTEPSMEVFSYHNGLGKWVEVGNSGVFRPEMLLPMGLPEDVSVIAWGLSLERPTMIKYGINNIRDLVGHKVDLQMIYNNPICRLDC